MPETLPSEPVNPQHFYIAVNTGLVGGNQSVSSHVPAGPDLRKGRGQRGRLPASLLTDAAKGFVAPEWMARARKRSRGGIVLLAGGRGTGRQTAALNLLCGANGTDASVHHLDDDLDFGSWSPAPGEANGYLVEGTLGGLVRNRAALTSIGSRLLEADAVMVVILPDDPELVARLEDSLGMAPVHCTPPAAERIFHAQFAVAVPGEEERRRLLHGLPPELLPELLPSGASPRDALDVVEAVIATGESPGAMDTRAARIRGTLAEQADREVAEFLPGWLDDPQARNALIAAAVFGGSSPQTIAEQAERLALKLEGASSDPGVSDLGGRRSLSALLRPVGVRTDRVQRPGRSPATHMAFARCQWPGAILRNVWRGPLADLLVPWLWSVEGYELVERAGWALALSVPPERGTGRLNRIRACATFGGPSGRAVAAKALRVLMNDPDLSREATGQLGSWAYERSWSLRCVAALTCGGGSEIAPLGSALALMRKLVRGAEGEPHRYVDRAVDDALLDLFRRGDRRVVLRTLLAWTEFEGAEAGYATRVLPKLLRRDLAWFGAQIMDDEVFALTVRLIRRTLRARGPGGALRDAVLLWRRVAVWDPIHREALDAVLLAVGDDRHPNVGRFLDAINRHD